MFRQHVKEHWDKWRGKNVKTRKLFVFVEEFTMFNEVRQHNKTIVNLPSETNGEDDHRITC